MGSWVGYREFDAEDGQTRRDFVRRVTPAGRLSLSSTPAGCAGHATKQDAVAAVRASFAGYPRAHGIRYGAVRLVEQDTPDPASGAGAGRLDPRVRAEVEAATEARSVPPRAPTEQRALQRRFADRVGVSPRLLRSIVRFRRVFDHAADPARAEGWLGAGLEAGYFDQPQMARDFRRFLGCTATDWAREQHDLARAIASQSYKPGVPPSA